MNEIFPSSIQYLNYETWSGFLTKIKTMNLHIDKNPENAKLKESILRINQLLASIEKTRQTLKRLEWNLERRPTNAHKKQFDSLLAQMDIAISAVEMEVIKIKLFAK